MSKYVKQIIGNLYSGCCESNFGHVFNLVEFDSTSIPESFKVLRHLHECCTCVLKRGTLSNFEALLSHIHNTCFSMIVCKTTTSVTRFSNSDTGCSMEIKETNTSIFPLPTVLIWTYVSQFQYYAYKYTRVDCSVAESLLLRSAAWSNAWVILILDTVLLYLYYNSSSTFSLSGCTLTGEVNIFL